jgi:hypothetical protein
MAANIPANSAASSVAKDLANQMQQAQAQAQQQAHEQTKTPTADFAGQFNNQQANQAKQDTKVSQAGKIETTRAGATNVLSQSKTNLASPSTRIGATEKVEESKLQGMIDNLVNGQDKMTKIMQMALSGRQFGPSELLAMQAGVYRYSQELDLTSKVVQQATSGIKQTLNTQV